MKTLLTFFCLIIFNQYNAQNVKYSIAPYNGGYACLVGMDKSIEYPLITITVSDVGSEKDMIPLSNGKCFPILNRFVRTKKDYIGSYLIDMVSGKSTIIKDIKLEASGKDSAVFTIIGKDFSKTIIVKMAAILSMQDDCVMLWDGTGALKISKKK